MSGKTEKLYTSVVIAFYPNRNKENGECPYCKAVKEYLSKAEKQER